MHEQDEDIWDGDELRPGIRAELVRRAEPVLREKENNDTMKNLVQWVPIYLALIGLFFSAANIYAQQMTRMATIETRLDLLTSIVNEIRTELKEERNERRDAQRR